MIIKLFSQTDSRQLPDSCDGYQCPDEPRWFYLNEDVRWAICREHLQIALEWARHGLFWAPSHDKPCKAGYCTDEKHKELRIDAFANLEDDLEAARAAEVTGLYADEQKELTP